MDVPLAALSTAAFCVPGALLLVVSLAVSLAHLQLVSVHSLW